MCQSMWTWSFGPNGTESKAGPFSTFRLCVSPKKSGTYKLMQLFSGLNSGVVAWDRDASSICSFSSSTPAVTGSTVSSSGGVSGVL